MQTRTITLATLVAVSLAAVHVVGAATAVGPALTQLPTAAGTPQQGKQLTGSTGMWTGSGTINYAFQWFRCDANGAHCSSISGAKAQGYKLGAKDVGHTLGLTVTATDTTGTTAGYASLVGPIAPASATLVPTTAPAMTGTAAQGQTLTAGAGTWSAPPSATTFAWYRCNANGRLCVAIPGAVAAAYTAVADDVGHALVALVHATAGAATGQAFSSASGAVVAAVGPRATTAPAVSGTPRQGGRLTSTPGTWSGVGTVSLAYQWYRCDANGAHCGSISGARAAGYKLGLKDVGRTVGLAVRGTDSTGTVTAYASLVGPISAQATAFVPTAQPAVSGTATVGSVLTVGNGTWSSTPAAYAYVWYRCNPNRRACVAIAGATQTTYTVAAADAGHTLAALVQATAGAVKLGTLSTASALVP